MQHQAGSDPNAIAAATSAEEQARRMADSCLGVRVGRLHRIVSRRFDAELRPLGVTLPQLEILAGLALAGAPSRPSDIAGWLDLERSTISRNLALMQARGLTAVAGTSATGRSMLVTITPEGASKLAAARDAWAHAQQSVLALVGDDAPELLSRWIGSLV